MVQDRRMKLVDYGNQPSPTTLPVRLSSLRHIQPHAILSQEICFVTYRGICTRVSVLVHFQCTDLSALSRGGSTISSSMGHITCFFLPISHPFAFMSSPLSQMGVRCYEWTCEFFLENRHWFWWTLMHFDTTNYITLYSPVLQLYRNV